MRVAAPGGSYKPWSPSVTPYMVEPMNELASRSKDAVIFAGPARTGKTVALLDGWLTHTVICDPSDLMILHMTKETGKDYSKRRADRLLRNSPELKKRMTSRASDDNVFDKFFKNGMMMNIGWPTVSQLSGKDIRFMAITDLDRMPLDIGGEGDVFGKAQKRTQTYMSRGMTLAESSPGFVIVDPDWKPKHLHEAPPVRGGIFPLYNRGDRRRLYWQCGSCFSWFMPTMDNFYIPDLEEGAEIFELARQAGVFCPHCSTMMQAGDKHEANLKSRWLKQGQTIDRHGDIEGEGKPSRWASFWMEGPAASFQPWEELASLTLHAQSEYETSRSEEALKKTVFDDQGRAYLPKSLGGGISPISLEERAELLGKRVVPQGVRYLVASIDVQAGRRTQGQGKRFVVQIIGFGVDKESWLVDRYNLKWSERCIDRSHQDDYDENKNLPTWTARRDNEPQRWFEPIDPGSYPEDWDILIQKVIQRSYEIDDETGRAMQVYATGCDSGGEAGVTENAYQFWRRLRKKGLHRKVRLLKGGSTKNAVRLRETFPDNTKRKDRKASARGDVPVLSLNTTVFKDAVSGAMTREEPGPGYMHFPDWLGEWFYKELTAEKRTDSGWERRSAHVPNEAFDLYCYGFATAAWFGAEKITWDSPPAWARDWDANSQVIDPDERGPGSKKAETSTERKPRRRTRFRFE